jgi:hypothetical protein
VRLALIAALFDKEPHKASIAVNPPDAEPPNGTRWVNVGEGITLEGWGTATLVDLRNLGGNSSVAYFTFEPEA